MNYNTIKQKKKIGCSVGLLLLASNIANIILIFILKLLDIQDDENKYIVAYIVNSVSIYVVGYTILKLVLRKTEHVENRPKTKLKFWELILFICIVIGGTQFVNLIFQAIISIIKMSFQIEINNDVAKIIKNANPILTVIFAVIIGPIFEELMFRGTLLKRLRVYGDKTAIIYTAIMFGIFHSNIEQIPYAISCGFILGYAYIKTNNIIYPIIFHVMLNGFSILLSIFLRNDMISAVIIQEGILMLFIILSLIFVPIFLATGKVKVTDKDAVHDNSKLYSNAGFIFSVVVTAVFTALKMFKF